MLNRCIACAALALMTMPPTALAVSPEYLDGPWCYSHYEAGGQRNEQNIDYVFNSDGSLLYQNNSGSAVDRPGTWSIQGERVNIHPTFMAFRLKVKEETSDRLVLTGLGNHVFTRGACP